VCLTLPKSTYTMNPLLQRIWKLIRNKYFIATVIFVILFVFLGDNNYMETLRLRKDVRRLEQQVSVLERGIEQDSINAEALKHDLSAIERYGREQYYMKCKDEDIYIIKK